TREFGHYSDHTTGGGQRSYVSADTLQFDAGDLPNLTLSSYSVTFYTCTPTRYHLSGETGVYGSSLSLSSSAGVVVFRLEDLPRPVFEQNGFLGLGSYTISATAGPDRPNHLLFTLVFGPAQ